MDFSSFQKITRSERASRDFVRPFCWPDLQAACPKCGDTKVYVIQNGRYRCSSCKYSFHDLTGRWFGLLRTSVLLAEGDGVFDRCSVEVDECYIGGRKKGTRGRGAQGKTPVLGMKSRDGRLWMEVMDDVGSESLIGAIRRMIPVGSIVYTDKFRSYNELSAVGYVHRRIDHSKYFANGRTHTNGIEGAWSFVKQGLAKHHGVSKRRLPLYLKEQEFRFNHRKGDLFVSLVERMCDFVPRTL